MQKVVNIVFAFIILLLLFVQFRGTKELNTTRRHLDTAREQLVRATDYNRELTERFGSLGSNVQKLGELTNRNVSGVRQCIEIIEETRVVIKEMEDCIYGSSASDSYYDYWDNEFGLK